MILSCVSYVTLLKLFVWTTGKWFLEPRLSVVLRHSIAAIKYLTFSS